MDWHTHKLKLRPLTAKKRKKFLVSKFLGAHQTADLTPNWEELVDEIREEHKTKRNRPAITTMPPCKLFVMHEPYHHGAEHGTTHTQKPAVLTYGDLHPSKNTSPDQNLHNAPSALPQFSLFMHKLKLLQQANGYHPELGLTIEDLIKIELLGGSITDDWLKRYLIWLNGGFNPSHYGELAFGYAEPGQIKRLNQQEALGMAPHVEPKLLFDRETLGLSPLFPIDEPRDIPNPAPKPRLIPTY